MGSPGLPHTLLQRGRFRYANTRHGRVPQEEPEYQKVSGAREPPRSSDGLLAQLNAHVTVGPRASLPNLQIRVTRRLYNVHDAQH